MWNSEKSQLDQLTLNWSVESSMQGMLDTGVKLIVWSIWQCKPNADFGKLYKTNFIYNQLLIKIFSWVKLENYELNTMTEYQKIIQVKLTWLGKVGMNRKSNWLCKGNAAKGKHVKLTYNSEQIVIQSNWPIIPMTNQIK
jgi:hypothetical protein